MDDNRDKIDESFNWLSGYVDAILENDTIKKKQIEKMIFKLSNDLELDYPLDSLIEEEPDDLPF